MDSSNVIKYKNTLDNVKYNQQANNGLISKCTIIYRSSTHSTTEGHELQTRLWWVKPGLWAQSSHLLCLEYLRQV